MEVKDTMKITASKRDDIIRRRDEYDADAAKRQAKYDEQYKRYKTDEKAVYDEVEAEVLANIPNAEALNIRVNVSRAIFEGGLEVHIYSNEFGAGENVALKWDWRVYLSASGEMKKESNSWSGLNACTAEQLQSLQMTLDALKAINEMPWESILSKTLPEYNDYITDGPANRSARPNFEQELLEADIEEAINNGSWIKGHGYKWYRKSATVYYKVLKATPKQYEVDEVYEGYMTKGIKPSPYKVTKEVFFQLIDKPLQIWEG